MTEDTSRPSAALSARSPELVITIGGGVLGSGAGIWEEDGESGRDHGVSAGSLESLSVGGGSSVVGIPGQPLSTGGT